ncbi:MAG: ISAzo13 family transposase, partial [Acidimicrobiales bacterium]
MELDKEGLSRFFSLTSPFLDERQRRLLAASMVEVLGRGGQARVAEATGMSRNTLIAGAKDLADGPVLGERARRPGAGPKRKIDLDPELLVVLDSLVEPQSRGGPMSPLRWTLKSTRALAA